MKYLSFALLLAGCGAEIDDLYGRSDTGDGAGNGTGAASSSPTNGGGPNNSSSNAGGAPSSNNSSSSNSSSNSNNSSTSTMGGMATTDVTSTNSTTGPDPASSQQTTSGPPDAILVLCGESMCDVSDGNVCCIGTLGESCVDEEQCLFTDVAATCDDPFDCDGGDVCCGFVDNSSYYEEIRCASECNWPDRTFCTPSGPPCAQIFTGGMLQDAECAQSSILPTGYLVCKVQ